MSKEMHAQFEVSQGAVIEDKKGDVLLLRLKNGDWGLPGGHLHKNEDWFAGLQREIREETGITKFNINGFVDISVFGSCYGVCFHASVEGVQPLIVLSDEHAAFAWVSSSKEVDNYTFCHPTLRKCVFKVFGARDNKF